jgi:hypothetical protein
MLTDMVTDNQIKIQSQLPVPSSIKYLLMPSSDFLHIRLKPKFGYDISTRLQKNENKNACKIIYKMLFILLK